MDGGVSLAIASMVASAVSGTVAYVGAQRQAKGLEQQAKSAEQWGQYNSTVARNNAQGEAQDLEFQAGLEQFNKKLELQNTSRRLDDLRTKQRIAASGKQAAGARRGVIDYSFSDVLRSDALLAEREIGEALYAGGAFSSQANSQSKLYRQMGDRSIEMGRVGAALALGEGQQRSFALRGQADSARIGGYAQLVSGLSSAASTGSTINYGGSWKPKDWKMK